MADDACRTLASMRGGEENDRVLHELRAVTARLRAVEREVADLKTGRARADVQDQRQAPRRLSLPDVTLIVYDVVAHQCAAAAAADILEKVAFGDVHIWTDQQQYFAALGGEAKWFPATAGLPKDQSLTAHWYEVPRHVKTSHLLFMDWDAGICDAGQWRDEFLQYDFIGAPWPWHPEGQRVGNSGFALCSTRLMLRLANAAVEYPYAAPWDDVLCRRYRPRLEAEGFRWAPEALAAQFSREHGPLRVTFGFHDCRNLPLVLPLPDLMRRLAAANDYVRGHLAWREMLAGLNR